MSSTVGLCNCGNKTGLQFIGDKLVCGNCTLKKSDESCGVVLEENCIDSEVECQENTDEGASAFGQLVSNRNRCRPAYIKSCLDGSDWKASREIIVKKAREGITRMGQQLYLNTHCADMAYKLYEIALWRRLSDETTSVRVSASCLYIACRLEGTAHVLTDIARVSKVNIFTLAKTFLEIAKDLHLTIPSADPCLYVMCFADGMTFGDKTGEVCKMALHLVHHTKGDRVHSWRLFGLSGAALLIAARHHGFSRTVNDVMKELQVHEKAVLEKMRKLGKITFTGHVPDAFLDVGIQAEPFTRRSSKMDRKDNVDEMDTRDMMSIKNEIDTMVVERLQKKRGPLAKFLKGILYCVSGDSTGLVKHLAHPYLDSDFDEIINDFEMMAIESCCIDSAAEASSFVSSSLCPSNTQKNEKRQRWEDLNPPSSRSGQKKKIPKLD